MILQSVSGANGEQSVEQKSNPEEITILDRCGQPSNVVLCPYAADDGLCATDKAKARCVRRCIFGLTVLVGLDNTNHIFATYCRAMRITWTRPEDLGSGDSNIAISITIYEIQVTSWAERPDQSTVLPLLDCHVREMIVTQEANECS